MFFDQFKYPFIPEIRFNIQIAIALRFEWVGNDILIQNFCIMKLLNQISRFDGHFSKVLLFSLDPRILKQ